MVVVMFFFVIFFVSNWEKMLNCVNVEAQIKYKLTVLSFVLFFFTFCCVCECVCMGFHPDCSPAFASQHWPFMLWPLVYHMVLFRHKNAPIIQFPAAFRWRDGTDSRRSCTQQATSLLRRLSWTERERGWMDSSRTTSAASPLCEYISTNI